MNKFATLLALTGSLALVRPVHADSGGSISLTITGAPAPAGTHTERQMHKWVRLPAAPGTSSPGDVQFVVFTITARVAPSPGALRGN